MRKSKTYWRLVGWIAGNDEPTCLVPAEIRDQITVQLVADTYSIDPAVVSRDILKIRDGTKKFGYSVKRRHPIFGVPAKDRP